MPIVYVHGVAVRDDQQPAAGSTGINLFDRLVQNIRWDIVREQLRKHIAPAISEHPDQVLLAQAYWGDLAARLAWDGASSSLDIETKTSLFQRPPTRSRVMAELRRPLNPVVAQFFGDVFCYLNSRGDETRPGPIPVRVLDILLEAQQVKEANREPLVVLTHSMGGQIMYDVVTWFLPRIAEYTGIKVDFWCSVGTQIGLFEEMKLFLASSPEYGKAHNNRVPFPHSHVGAWWNVWDIDDLISYRVSDIFEGVDETEFRVGRRLLEEHTGYLQNESFYRLFAKKLSSLR